MIRVPLTKGLETTIDEVDIDLVTIKWHTLTSADSKTLAYAMNKRLGLMHRIILARKLQTPLGKKDHVDHIDGNGLNNCRSNIRLATISLNHANQKKRSIDHGKPCLSKFKGVTWVKRTRKWQAYIRPNGKQTHLGYFTSEVEAARAYDRAALEHFGEFALINFPGEQ
jgi:hypothetical protein